MVCTSIQNKTFDEIVAILERPEVEMAEIRLDLCPLDNGEIEELFSSSDTPLVATCRLRAVPMRNTVSAWQSRPGHVSPTLR